MRTQATLARPEVVIPRRAWYALLLTSFGQFFVIFDSTVLNVAFPSIERSFPSVDRTTLAWALTSYSIGTASLLLLAGRIADLFGRKRVFLTGISVFALASLAAGLARSVPLLIAARSVQSIGGALMIPTSIALALPEFPPQRRSLAVGVWGSIAALAGGLGPPIGAAVIELGGWRWIFFINVPVVALVVVLGRKVLRESVGQSSGVRIDIVSIPLGTVALAALTLGVLKGERWGWTSPGILGCFAVTGVFLTIVVLRSKRHPEPLIDLSLFRHRRFNSASISTFLFNLPVAGFWFTAPLFMQTVWHWSVLKSGVAIMPTPIVLFFAATFAGRVSDRGWMKPIIGFGMTFVTLAVFGFFIFLGENSHYWTHYFPFAIVYGIALGLSWSTLTGAALVGIDHQKFGVANGTNLTFRTIGGTMGVAMVIAVSGAAGVAGSAAAFHRVFFALFATFALATLVFGLAYPGRFTRRAVDSAADLSPRPLPTSE
jgi:EmrB/QacA subfamily drug resistance transporter